MTSVVLELQREALDRNIRISDLLRKALVISRKLKQSEFQKWVEDELNGYKREVPNYRIVWGQVRGWNPYTRIWMPLIFSNPEEGDAASKRPAGQSVAELESLIESGESDGYHIPFSQKIQRQLSKGFDFETEISLHVPHTSIVKILDAVRTVILNWALALEEEGISGEGLLFSEMEKQAAVHSPQNINNFFGAVQNPQIAQGNHHVIQEATLQIDATTLADFLRALEDKQSQFGLNERKLAELQSDMATLQAQAKSPNPKNTIVRESLTSIRNILEGAVGGAASPLLFDIGKMLFG
jgi:hypothetical protein